MTGSSEMTVRGEQFAHGEVKTLATATLDIAYFDEGPVGAPAVLLLHGWPDDPLGLTTVAAGLRAKGFRTIMPWLRGFGATRFRSPDTLRDGRGVALAQDAIDLLDGLAIERCMVVGHDWGGRAAYHLAALIPDRLTMIAALAIGYAPNGSFPPPEMQQARLWWYQWFMTTDAGVERVHADPIGFARIQWETWSPPGWFDEEDFDRTAESFRNPDWASVTLHGYRSRWRAEALDPRYALAQGIIEATRSLSVPALLVQGAADGCDPASSTDGDPAFFTAPYRRTVLDGVGHFPARESPEAVVDAIADFQACL